MNAFLVCAARWMLATFWVFGTLQQSESAIVCQVEPENPKIVVLGVNSNKVSLDWRTCGGTAGETVISYAFARQRPGSVTPEQIASRGATEGGFDMIAPFQDKKKYAAFANQELQIFDVKEDEEYVYTLTIDFRASGGAFLEKLFQVTVEVKVPPQITTAPTREIQLSLSSSSVQNYTLRCNASGDPHPNINWTKDGVPASQFNDSGYFLHLVNVQKTDAGSYICTADNGFGNATAIGIVNIRCSDCKVERVGITIALTFKQAFENPLSSEFEGLESPLLSAIWGVYANNPGKQLHRADVVTFRDGSVYAIVELAFGPSVSDPLKPLRDEINDGKLGPFTVDRELDLNPTSPPATTPTETTTEDTTEPASTDDPDTGLSATLWGIIGACIAVVFIVFIIILVWCICRTKGKNKGDASKGGKSYSEADGYRMNRQPPPSGLGTASPAYVEARQYARRQDDQSKAPLNYADLSFNNSSGPGRQPPPYSGTEYSEMSPEKRPPPAGGQKGEGGGFELWC